MPPLPQYPPHLVNHNVDLTWVTKVKETVRIDRVELLIVGGDAEERRHNCHQIPNATPAAISLRDILDFGREAQEK